MSRTCGWLRKWRVPFALLHCISSYPVADADANLCWIGELADRFGVPVGYSDHATDELAGALAVAAGGDGRGEAPDVRPIGRGARPRGPAPTRLSSRGTCR